jgi:hypothetical protein
MAVVESPAIAGVGDEFGGTVVSGDDARECGGHALEDGIGAGVVVGRVDEEIGGGVPWAEIGDVPGLDDAVGEPGGGDGAAVWGEWFAGDGEGDVLAVEEGEGFEEDGETLAAVVEGDEEEERAGGREIEGGAGGGAVIRREPERGVDGGVDDADGGLGDLVERVEFGGDLGGIDDEALGFAAGVELAFEGEFGLVFGTPAFPPWEVGGEAGVAAAAGAMDVLFEGAAEAEDDIDVP